MTPETNVLSFPVATLGTVLLKRGFGWSLVAHFLALRRTLEAPGENDGEREWPFGASRTIRGGGS